MPGVILAGDIVFYSQSCLRCFQYDKYAGVPLALILGVVVIEGFKAAFRQRLSYLAVKFKTLCVMRAHFGRNPRSRAGSALGSGQSAPMLQSV